MATTTTNFGWDIPQSTDLVKDGATAIAALGQDIDTAFVDLKGGTTGQVLAKASNTDLDYSWVAQDDSNAIQNAIVDAKGDLIAATANDTPARLAVGANATMLVANSAESTGLKWTTATDQFPWQAWTPTYTNLTVGNGIVTAKYQQIGKTVNFIFFFQMGSTSSMGSVPQMTMPVTPANDFGTYTVHINDFGTTQYFGAVDTSAGKFYPTVWIATGSYVQISYLAATTPMTWTTNDSMTIRGSYEAA